MTGLFLVLWNVLFPVMLIFGAGYFIGRKFTLDYKSFTTLSIYVLSPALVFQAIYQYKDIFTFTTLKIFFAVTIVIIITIAAVELVSLLFKFPKSLKTVLILTLVLTNSGNYGLPVTDYAYGKEGLYIASLLLVIYNFYTHTLGIFVAASDKTDVKTALIKMAKVPVFYAMVLALLLSWFKIDIPKPVFSPIQAVGLSAIPINLLLVGVTLSKVKLKKDLPLVFLVSFIKLAVIPVIAIIVLAVLGIHGLDFKVSLVQIAMPSAIYSTILTSHFDSDARLASGIVLVSLLFSVISLSGIIFLLH
jgi:malate permease and related proteins